MVGWEPELNILILIMIKCLGLFRIRIKYAYSHYEPEKKNLGIKFKMLFRIVLFRIVEDIQTSKKCASSLMHVLCCIKEMRSMGKLLWVNV